METGTPTRRAVTLVILGLLTLQAGWIVTRAAISDGFYSLDDYTHLLISREVLDRPILLIDVWGRPLMTLVYLPATVVGGDGAVRVTSLVILLVTAGLCAGTAKARGLPAAPAAAVLLLAQPLTAATGFAAVPVTVFSLVLAAALYLQATGRHRSAALVAALLPLARLEGILVLAVWAFFLVRSGRVRLVPLLGVGMVAWALCGFAYSGDVLWLAHQNPYGVLGSRYDRAGWGYAFGAVPKAMGLGAGLTIASFVWRRRVDPLVAALAVALFVFYTVAWGLPAFQIGPDVVYILGASVPFALCAHGALVALAERRSSSRRLAFAVALLVAVLAVPSSAVEDVPAMAFVMFTLGLLAAGWLALRVRRSWRHLGAGAVLAGLVLVSLAFTKALPLQGSSAASRRLVEQGLADEVDVYSQPAFGWYSKLPWSYERMEPRPLPAGSVVLWDANVGGQVATESRMREWGYVPVWEHGEGTNKLVLFERR